MNEETKPHTDLTEENTAVLLPKKQDTNPGEIAIKAAAQKDPFFAEWIKQRKRSKKRWLDII